MTSDYAMLYMINHVFLPPKLPNGDDFNVKHDMMLLDTAIDVLTQFGACIMPNDSGCISTMIQTVQNMKKHHSVHTDGAIDQELLVNSFRDLCVDGGTIALHVRAQNAGVIISKVSTSPIHVEVFELSPSNDAVMTTQGRLKRQFPASAVSLTEDEFKNPSFQAMLAHTLAEMSCHAAVGTRPKARKAGQLHDEDRDTNHPKLVTELLIALLSSIGQPVVVSAIGKNTRDDVVWQDSRHPWRRSPLWLLIRVTLQLMFSRSSNQLKAENNAYKIFMIFFMAYVLESAKDSTISDELLYVMKAKICRRLLKISASNSFIPQFAINTVNNVDKLLEARWADIVAQSTPQLHLQWLETLQFECDAIHTLPTLNNYVDVATLGKDSQNTIAFHPQSIYIEFNAAELPQLSRVDSAGKSVAYTLCAFETWIELHLQSWLEEHKAGMQVTESIGKLIPDYHRLAQRQYSGNPEALSGTILIILELWVACDQSAVHHCELLRDYKPAIPLEPFQSLLLPTYQQMKRLLRAETYLSMRRQHARYASTGIFKDFGGKYSFSVKYFTRSTEHQELLQVIEEEARQIRVKKCDELRDKQSQYRKLMENFNSSTCEYEEVIVDWELDRRESRHKATCQRCRYLSRAKAIQIDVHEWPLPRQRLEAQSAVFELRVPSSFGCWRDLTAYVVIDVLRYEYASKITPRSHYALSSYSGLLKYHTPHSVSPRLLLLSEAKPHGSTHRGRKTIDIVTEEDICLHNGLHFQHYDNNLGTFTNDFSATEQISDELTLKLPSKSQSLQRYLFRPASMPNGPSPNSVIASQSDCPDHMSLGEYKAIASLGLGYRILWHNLLVQVAAPSVDFKNVETTLAMLQLIYQAGLSNDNDCRVSHAIVQRKDFAHALLQNLEEAFGRIKENWESAEGLSLFICIALRILSLNFHDEIIEQCLVLLTAFRTTAFDWTIRLQEKSHDSDDETQRNDLARRSVETALICVQSLNVDSRYLITLVSDTSFASIFMQCAIIIHDGMLKISSSASTVIQILRYRWKTLSYKLCPLLANSIVVERSSSLDNVLMHAWPAYRAGSAWQKAPGTAGDWLVCSTDSAGSLIVHFNLITGALLVGGVPLSRLPADYETSGTYSSLFGNRVFDVMPSVMPGMQFSASRKQHGYELHFGMNHANEAASQDIRILAIKPGTRRMLIPRRVLQSYFPAHFCDEYLHWYDMDADAVEFCPIDDAWTTSEANWWLRKCSDRANWHLVRHDTLLVSVRSRTAQVLANILSPVEDATRIHTIYHPSRSAIHINVHRLRLGFYLKQGEAILWSKQFRHMNLDPDQNIGTLIGLKSKLVLRCSDGHSRIVVIPEGPLSCTRQANHVHVEINRGNINRFHTYRVDSMLGRLVDNGSLPSKLLLIYLHALTSYCLTDPLTSKTGTEQSLSILRSAGVRSFDHLTSDEISMLEKIAGMTPARSFYPANERVMQSVEWSSTTSFLSQHGAFCTDVQNIFDQVQAAKAFYPKNSMTISQLQHAHPDLLKRDCIRSSSYYVANYGAEKHTTDLDVKYDGRDKNQASAAAIRAFAIAKFVLQEQATLPFAPPAGSSYLWAFFLKKGETLGPMHAVPDEQLMFSVQILQKPFELVTSHWASIHYKLSNPETRPCKYAFAACLSTMAFATDSNMHVIQALGSLLVLSQMAQVQAPVENHFHLRSGVTMEKQELRKILDKHSKAFRECPESSGISQRTAQNVRTTKHEMFQRNRAQSIKHVLDDLMAQWPCRSPRIPQGNNAVHINTYLRMQDVANDVRPCFEKLDNNRRFLAYLQQIEKCLPHRAVRIATFAPMPISDVTWDIVKRKRHISLHEMLTSEAPTKWPDAVEPLEHILITTASHNATATEHLAALIERVDAQGTCAFTKNYCSEMRRSLGSLQSHKPSPILPAETYDVRDVLTRYREQCHQHTYQCYSLITDALFRNTILFPVSKMSSSNGKTLLKHFSRWSPTFFLQLLRRDCHTILPIGWKRAIVRYALALTSLQQANRMLQKVNSPLELIKELQNPGHRNWDPMEFPESLLLEVESDIMIREPQERIAQEMRSPRSNKSAVVQLNMGDGKSSVIVPIVAAALADTSKLVRIIVGKAQAKQMFQMLLSKLGGLLNRKICHLPFSRELKLDEVMSQHIYRLCHECMSEGGVLLVQPEHLLSFKLMGLECMISGKFQIGQSLMHTLEFWDEFARDVVDESDEIFSVKFELIYGMGMQQPVDLSPERWLYHQKILDLVPEAAIQIHENHPTHVELNGGPPSSFPRIRLLQQNAQSELTSLVAEKLCATGLHGFPVAQLPLATRYAIQKYIGSLELTSDDVARIEATGADSFWTDTTKEILLLLRGLLAVGILAFVLSQKRWRVNYGLDANRRPRTRLAVPYRAKDSPSMRAEFSHPDVAILLTSLSYYYGGLDNDEMFLAFDHIVKSDQADVEYQLWVKNAVDLSTSFQQLLGVNLKDRVQCTTKVFPALRYSKAVIDYFLAHIVFPKEMREFPQKLTASGWDIGETRRHPTTGFSGTIDSHKTLPLSLHFEDLVEQQHTNALVLSYLLRPENEVLLMPSQSSSSDATALLEALSSIGKAPRVILDVGAQIVDVDNLGVAQKWLEISVDHEDVQAVVFFNDNDELSVIDRNGRIELLQTSSFANRLDVCLVYLDEVHTRGTDLKLPDHYRAAVALGPRVTKDRLIQACMRMRKLGQGQAVVFCVPDEIKHKIMDCTHKIDSTLLNVSDVLHWAMSETYADLCRAIPLWAVQGRRFEHQSSLWNSSNERNRRCISQSQATGFLEKESLTLEDRYHPTAYQHKTFSENHSPSQVSSIIESRHREFDILQYSSVSLQRDQEQERELACEVERERQVQRPPPASPSIHYVEPDLRTFIATGILHGDTQACQPAFKALRDTSAATYFDVQAFPTDLWVTYDFTRTIQVSGSVHTSDLYQRSVQWVLVGGSNKDVNFQGRTERVIIISPYEAQELLPQIESSRHVTLHLYAPRINLGYRSLDTLDLYSTSTNPKHRALPRQVIMLLNLFSGQVYFDSYAEYVEMCKFLDVNWKLIAPDQHDAFDSCVTETEDIKKTMAKFPTSPLKFLQTHMTKVRRNNESIEKTHVGQILGGVLLQPELFEPEADWA